MPYSITEIEDGASEDIDFDAPILNADKSILYVYNRTYRNDEIVLPDTVKRIFRELFPAEYLTASFFTKASNR